MPAFRKLAVATALIFFCVLVFLGFQLFHGWIAKPLGEGAPITVSTAGMSQLDRQQFLDGDFNLIKDVKALPAPILQAYSEQGGTRLLMANPGKRFEATDSISDPSVPRKRLIFAGVSNGRCFVHYEQGGIGHMYILAFFKLNSGTAELIWRGYCGPAANFQELRSLVRANQCSGSVPSNWE